MTKFFVEDIMLETEDEKKERLTREKELELEIARLELELVKGCDEGEDESLGVSVGVLIGAMIGFAAIPLLKYLTILISSFLDLSSSGDIYLGCGLGFVVGFLVVIGVNMWARDKV